MDPPILKIQQNWWIHHFLLLVFDKFGGFGWGSDGDLVVLGVSNKIQEILVDNFGDLVNPPIMKSSQKIWSQRGSGESRRFLVELEA